MPDIVARVRDVASLVRRHAEEGERNRRIPQEVVRRFEEVGIYRLLVPLTLGGLEQDAVTFVRVIEALAAADGSSGWFAMIAGLGGLLAGLVPAATDVRVVDTWSVSGLCGTGSHDIEVGDVLVPARRVIRFGDPPVVSAPLYAFPSQSMLAIGVASVALGIARSAIDALVQRAATNIPIGAVAPLAARASAQIQIAQAEAAVRAARPSFSQKSGRHGRCCRRGGA